MERQPARRGVELLDERKEDLQARAGARSELLPAGGARLPQRRRVGARICAQNLECPCADPARGQVHHALERGVVVAIADQAQVGQRVLDLGALEEPQAPVDAIRDAAGEQVFLEHARLRIRAVQDRGVRALPAACDPVADTADDELGFVALVVGAVEADRRAALAAGPELLADAPAVVGDDRVGGGQDVAGRAVVLLETEELHAREIPAELLQVLDPRTAPAIDGLVVVADDEGDADRSGERLDPGVLDRVRVLELVDQDVSETAAVMLDETRCLPPELETAQQQLGEIHYAVAPAGLPRTHRTAGSSAGGSGRPRP